MAVIPIEEVVPGMVLAEEVRDLSGRLLLGAGQEVSARHLNIFLSWGVVEAVVEETVEERAKAPDAPDGAANPEGGFSGEPMADAGEEPLIQRSETTMASVRDYFQLNDLGHPLMKALFDCCLATLKEAPSKPVERL